MRNRVLTMVFAVFVACGSTAIADEASWTVQGRTQMIETCTNQFGDKSVFVWLTVSFSSPPDGVSPLPYSIDGRCPQSLWSTCESTSHMLGSCTKQTLTGTLNGTTCVQTSCVNPQTARCQRMIGHLTPGRLIEDIAQSSGCQF